jgi:hypothetical protein
VVEPDATIPTGLRAFLRVTSVEPGAPMPFQFHGESFMLAERRVPGELAIAWYDVESITDRTSTSATREKCYGGLLKANV